MPDTHHHAPGLDGWTRARIARNYGLAQTALKEAAAEALRLMDEVGCVPGSVPAAFETVTDCWLDSFDGRLDRMRMEDAEVW